MASVYLNNSHFFVLTESELLQSEVSVVTTGEAAGAESKTPPALRRRKRTCSRRQGDKEIEREVGGAGSGDRADRGVREHRDRREAGKSACKQLCCGFFGFCLFFFSNYLQRNIMPIMLNNYIINKIIERGKLHCKMDLCM